MANKEKLSPKTKKQTVDTLLTKTKLHVKVDDQFKPGKDNSYWTLGIQIDDIDMLLKISEDIKLDVKDVLFQAKGRSKKEVALIKEAIIGALMVEVITSTFKKEEQKKVEQGIQDSAAGRVKSRGSFSKYAKGKKGVK